MGKHAVLDRHSTWRSVTLERILAVILFLSSLGGFTVPAVAATLLLPHLAVGGGYTTTITILAGGTAVNASHLALRDQNGNPLVVRTGQSLPWSEATFNVAQYGSQIWELESLDPSGQAQVGSATIEYDGSQGTLYGVATYEFRYEGFLLTTVGVIGSQPLTGVSIPVDSDDRQDRYSGFAIANPAAEDLDLTVTLFDTGGKQVNRFPLRVTKLGQTARFLHQLVPSASRFRGMMVIKSATGGQFAAVALSQRSGIFASVPVIPTALYPF